MKTPSDLWSLPSGQPVTVLSLDGNRLCAAAVSIDEKGYTVVHRVGSRELSNLLVHMRRAVHPIFMDTDYLEFPDLEAFRTAARDLLSEPDFQNPFVAILPDICVHERVERVEKVTSEHGRLKAMLRSLQSANPQENPRVFAFHHQQAPDGQLETILWSARFEDLTLFGEVFQEIPLPFLGLVTVQRALRAIMTCIAPPAATEALTLIHVNKLSTHYAGAWKKHPLFCASIPVGLARDGTHYFKAIPLRLDRLQGLSDQHGGLLFPPDVTPSPLFDPFISSPQIDCTRLALQVSRYGLKVLRDLWRVQPVSADNTLLLGGQARHLPGMKEYIEDRTERPIRLLQEIADLPDLILKHPETASEALDCLPAIGAGMAFHRRTENEYGLVLWNKRPKHLSEDFLDHLDRLEKGRVYVGDFHLSMRQDKPTKA